MNARGRVAVTIDCTDCNQTGYANFWTAIRLDGYYTPGPVKRWNSITGALSFLGECSLKFHAKWKEVLSHTDYLAFNDAEWQFNLVEDPGVALGQPRLIYALSRR